jgi:hypothetical protein
MEVDFDKEIDALLRKARHDGPVLVGDARHLDADEIAAYAENALPETARGAYTLHLADCDRCRKILSNLLVMNSEAAPAAASPSVITIAERDLPWYRKLFLYPNLAYVMGGLVLVFGGFLAFTIVQRSGMSGGAVVTQITDSEARRGGPNAEVESSDIATSPNAANAAANIAVGSASASANSNTSATTSEPGVSGPRASTDNFLADGNTPADQVAPAPPPPAAAAGAQPPPKEDRVRDDALELAKGRAEEKAPMTVARSEAGKNDAQLNQASNMAAQSGPMNQNDRRYQSQLEKLDSRAAAPKKSSADKDEEGSGRRAVGGRTFERKQGVWYDTNYQGRPTINVRRGSAEFERLDAGLRSIANSLSGTVVVVWGAKAYRIN